MSTNLHPVDELGEIRDQIKQLQAREATLREYILSGVPGMVGDMFSASVSKSQRETVDKAALIAAFGLQRVQPYLKTSDFEVLKVNRK